MLRATIHWSRHRVAKILYKVVLRDSKVISRQENSTADDSAKKVAVTSVNLDLVDKRRAYRGKHYR